MNIFWIIYKQQDCLGANKIVEMKYFHRAILPKSNRKPLSELTIVFSSYVSPERDYLYSLATALGATVNDRYARSDVPIFICPAPEGKKFLGAHKWSKFCTLFVVIFLRLINFVPSSKNYRP